MSLQRCMVRQYFLLFIKEGAASPPLNKMRQKVVKLLSSSHTVRDLDQLSSWLLLISLDTTPTRYTRWQHLIYAEYHLKAMSLSHLEVHYW